MIHVVIMGVGLSKNKRTLTEAVSDSLTAYCLSTCGIFVAWGRYHSTIRQSTCPAYRILPYLLHALFSSCPV